MKKKTGIHDRLAAGLLSLAIGLSLLLIVVALTPTPTVHIEGLELRMVGEYETDNLGQYVLDPTTGLPKPVMVGGVQKQSVQALVSISISNTEMCYGGYVPVLYNENYLIPSDWVTNGEIGFDKTKVLDLDSVTVDPDPSRPYHHSFFQTDSDLYPDGDPFNWNWQNSLIPGTALLAVKRAGTLQEEDFPWEADQGLVAVGLALQGPNTPGHPYPLSAAKENVSDLTPNNRIMKVTWGNLLYPQEDYYIYTGSDKIMLGTLSFQVNENYLSGGGGSLEDKLKDLVARFNGSTDGGSTIPGDTTSPLLQVVRMPDTVTPDELRIFSLKKGIASNYSRNYDDDTPAISINVASDDVIVKARPVNEEVTINAYEAFTDGRVSDLALAMQKYAGDIRATYVSGTEADKSIYWGDPVDSPTSVNMPADGPGMFIQKVGSTTVYRFTWDPGSTAVDKFRFEEKQPDGSFLPADPTLFYDPRGGQYIIRQYFTYWEKDGIPGAGGGTGTLVLKTLPIPMEVKLTVTPVTAVDGVVDKQDVTYHNRIEEVPSAFDGLDLADEARIVLDTALSGVVPTVPVSWTPDPMPAGWTPGILDNTITGTAKAPNPASVANWPVTAPDFTGQTGIGDYVFTTQIDETNPSGTGVRDRYPWLTVDPAWLAPGGSVRLDSNRRIVPVGATLASNYVMEVEPFENVIGDEIAQLRVTIRRQDDTGVGVDMLTGYTFRLFLPNGEEIILSPSTGNWFTDPGGVSYAGSAYRPSQRSTSPTDPRYYELILHPGALGAADAYAGNRERLRSYINLGGWFGAKVQEPGSSDWSDMLMAFSQPRVNPYISSYILPTPTPSPSPTVSPSPSASPTPTPAPTPTPTPTPTPPPAPVEELFDYTGSRSGLMPFTTTSVLPTFITLPADDTVATRYDGLTGSQPGRLRQFAVDAWSNVSGDKGGSPGSWSSGEIVTYGQDLFARSYTYSSYGRVVNPDTGSATGYPAAIRDRQVTVKLQVPARSIVTDPSPDRTLLLTYEQNAGDRITTIPNAAYSVDEVKRVTFDSKVVNYTYQQIVTLTLTNAGNTEIRGLRVEIPALTAGGTPYFKLVTAPPPVLAAGAKATFQITYQSNLPVGTYENIDTTIPIRIWHDDCGTKPAKDFEAVLRVTKSKPHQVTLVVRPDGLPSGSRDMGDAGLVEGVTYGTGGGADSYSYTVAPDTYILDDVFWVVTTPRDEYALLSDPYYYSRDPELDPITGLPMTDGSGNIIYKKVYLTEYAPASAASPDPSWDTSFRKNSANGDRNQLFHGTMPDYAVTVYVDYYEPLYSKLRLSDLVAYADPVDTSVWGSPQPLRDTAKGDYKVISFDPKKDEYIVILKDMDDPLREDWCGLSVTLRALETKINGVDPRFENEDITPEVEMRLDDGSGTLVGATPRTGNTDTAAGGPTTHVSNVFAAPYEEPGQNTVAQKTVTITISYDGSGLHPAEGYVERVYKVRFVRKVAGEAKHISLAGNSPYGMIENESHYTAAEKTAAKAAFDVGNRFTSTYTPHKARDLTNIYWPEAWGSGTNYDKDETALFVYLGEDFYDPGVENIYNNAGDLIDGIPVKRSLESYSLLDTGLTTPYDRFNGGAGTAPIDLGAASAVDGSVSGATVTQFAGHTDIRPGIYKLTYTFTDYDGTSEIFFTRPLIVLSANGDVDADGDDPLNATNADWILHRFQGSILPLGLSGYSDADKLLYRYRILDANNDRNINNVDGNLILRTPTKVKPFYRPTDYICF